MTKSKLNTIWLMFIVFVVLFIFNFGIEMDAPPTQRMWLLLNLWAVSISVLLLIKNKLPTKKQTVISILLAAAALLSYIDISIYSMARVSIVTLLSSLALFSTFNRYSNGRLVFLDNRSKKSITISILVGVAAGIVLGVINLIMSGNGSGDFSLNLSYFRTALSPALYEEIALRALFYGFCLSLLNGKIETKSQKFTCWFMMIIPHVLVHTPESFINGGILSGIISIIMYVLLFGLPFAVLQKKRDITSAMLAHGLVDLIRFCFHGI